MKRALQVCFLVAALALGCLVFTSCSAGQTGEKEPLRILVDGFSSILVEGQMPRIQGLGFTADYEIEYLPQHTYRDAADEEGDGEDREMALSRIRTEIMAGEGPDIYLCLTPDVTEQAHQGVEPLFPFPQKAAKNGAFLPIDEYLPTARHMEWENFEPTVMSVGKTELGQCILPMNYTFHVSLFNRDEVSPTEYSTMTYEEMLQKGDPVLYAAAVEDPYFFVFGDSFGNYADFETDTFNFTQEDLYQRVKESYLLYQKSGLTLGDNNIINSCFETPLHSSFYFGFPNMWKCIERESPTWENGMIENPVNLRDENRSAEMIPLYNDQGGVTANITAWAAIDSHTDYPEEAFSFLDALFSTNVMQSILFGGTPGISINSSLGTKWKQSAGGAVADAMWCVSEDNWEELQKIRSQINAVKFLTPLDGKLFNLREQFYLNEGDEQSLTQSRELVTKVYSEMEKMLGES